MANLDALLNFGGKIKLVQCFFTHIQFAIHNVILFFLQYSCLKLLTNTMSRKD